jgi:2-dehydro-3-deoxyphosphogluconate aldolase/(4S)-4-hydroxy-2-oxoglutarate aldolase
LTAETMLLTALERTRIVGIVRETDTETALTVARRLVELGLQAVEVSATTPGAVEAVAQLATEFRDRHDLLLGLGTVLDPEQVSQAARAGASFVIAPTYDPAVVRAAVDQGLAAIPGCATPSEMQDAHRTGAAAVKIFPAVTWSPKALRAMLEALPHLRCVPTGGIGFDDVRGWLGAGAFAVGLGSSLSRAARLPDLA